MGSDEVSESELAVELNCLDEVEEGVLDLEAVPRQIAEKDVVDLGYPVYSDGRDLSLLKKETIEDTTLKNCRQLGETKSMGYSWKFLITDSHGPV